MRQHRIHVADVAIGLQDRLPLQKVIVADMPLQIADPQHQFGDLAGARVQLQPQEFLRVHLMGAKAGQRLLAAEVEKRFHHLALQPLHQFQRHIEEVAGSARRIEYARGVELFMEGFDSGDGLFRLPLALHALRRGKHPHPLLPQRLDEGCDHEAFHIGARRVMRAKPGALPWVQRLFQKRAEDRRVHLAPILLRGFEKFADLLPLHLEGGGVLEQLAVEAAYLALRGGGIVAPVHRLPQHFKFGREDVGLLRGAFQKIGEGILRQKLHIFREHGEDAAHEEGRHLLRRKVALLHALRHGGKPLRNLARGFDGAFGRVEAVRVSPDGAEQRLHLGLRQIVEEDAEALPVRELGVVAALAGEVGVKLEAVAHIAHDDEGRPVMRGWKLAGIVLRLLAGVVHQRVPLARGAGDGGFLVFRGQKVWLVGQLAPVTTRAGLLRFEHEAALLVEVDEVAALVAPHIELELVVGFLRLLEAQRLAELEQECLRLRPLAARSAAPIRDETVNHCRRHGLTLGHSDFNRKYFYHPFL